MRSGSRFSIHYSDSHSQPALPELGVAQRESIIWRKHCTLIERCELNFLQRMLSDDAGERVKSAAGVMTRGNSVLYRIVQLMWSASGCCMKPLHQLEQTILEMELLLTVIAHCSGMRAKWNRKCINCGCKRRAQLYANAHPSSAVTVIVTVMADDDMPYLIPVSFLKPSLI